MSSPLPAVAYESRPRSTASFRSEASRGVTPEELPGDDHTEVEYIPEAVLAEYIDTFKELDADGSGTISVDEIQEYLEGMEVDMSEIDVDAIVTSLDADGNGDIDIDEFIVAMHSISQARRAVRSVAVYRDFDVDDLIKSPFERFRDSVWTLMETPESSKLARVVATIIVGTVAVSAVSFIIESLPSIHKRHTDFFETLEIIAISIFTAEFLVRAFAARSLRSFLTSPLNVIDLLAILPFYVERLAGQFSWGGASSIRVLRVARIFRLIKMSRYVEWLRMFFRTIGASAAPLGMIFFVTLLAVVFFSSGAYFFERGTWDEDERRYFINGKESKFGDIPSAFWWCVITMTTVGYGDIAPITTWGRIFGAWTAMCGVIILAMPISVISHHFKVEYARMIKARRIRAEQKRVAKTSDEPIPATPALGPLGSPVGVSRILPSGTKEWSTPYLRAVLDSIKASRLEMLASTKQLEARNREGTVEGIHEVLEDMTNERVNRVMRRASMAGIV